MKIFFSLFTLQLALLVCVGRSPKTEMKDLSDSLTKLTRNSEFDFSASMSSPTATEGSGFNFSLNSEFGYINKKKQQKSSRLIELNYRIGYTKLNSPVWYRDNDLLKLKAKTTFGSRVIHFNFQSTYETALTNSIFINQKNSLLKEEFEGKKLFVPSRLLIGVGLLVNISSTSTITLNFSPSNFRIMEQNQSLPDFTQIIHKWKNNLLIYELGLLLETEFSERISRHIKWKNQTTAYISLPKTTEIKTNTKNKFEYTINPIVSINLKSELDYNLRLSTHLMSLHTIMLGITIIK